MAGLHSNHRTSQNCQSKVSRNCRCEASSVQSKFQVLSSFINTRFVIHFFSSCCFFGFFFGKLFLCVLYTEATPLGYSGRHYWSWLYIWEYLRCHLKKKPNHVPLSPMTAAWLPLYSTTSVIGTCCNSVKFCSHDGKYWRDILIKSMMIEIQIWTSLNIKSLSSWMQCLPLSSDLCVLI